MLDACYIKPVCFGFANVAFVQQHKKKAMSCGIDCRPKASSLTRGRVEDWEKARNQ